ncbi:glycosyltransferase family 39 protein [Anaerolineales bacterium HSG24]|nr:glycosyltransferase family 39 protein [Anaerolineales bacterium HSG24]
MIRKPLYHNIEVAKLTVSQRFAPILVPLIVFIIALLPRIANLDVFLTADEDDQIMFASLFLKAILNGDPGNALVLGYPGVPTLILGACGIGLRYLFHYSDLLPLPWVTGDLMTTLEQTTMQFGMFDHPLDFIMWVRAPMAIAAALCVVGIYLLAQRLLGEPLALLGSLIIAFDPFILAHSRVIHVDAPLAYFMFLAFLAFILYIIRGQLRYLIMAGLFAGLAALSKTGPAVFLGPILMIGGLFYVALYPCPVGQSRWVYWKRLVMALVGCGLIGSLAFFALWPTMWTQPTKALTWIMGNLKSVNKMHHPTTGVFWGDWVTDQSPYYYLYVLPYHFTPLVTVGSLAGLMMIVTGLWSHARHRLDSDSWLADKLPLAMALASYVVLFVTPVSFVSRRGDRYILPVYFATALLAALGIWWLATWLAHRTKFVSTMPGVGQLWYTISGTPGRLLGVAVLLQIVSVLLYHPYYLAYYNPLMGGGQTAPYMLNIGWGEGLDQAARYLNDKMAKEQSPSQSPSQVAAWYSNQFAPYYNGRTIDLSDHGAPLYSDFTVFYLNQVQRGFPSAEMIDYFRQREPLHVVKLGGVNYAWIYDGPVISQEAPTEYTYQVGSLLGGGANLLGLDIPETEISADQYAMLNQNQPDTDRIPIFTQSEPGLPITLHWETVARISGEHNVYIRLVDEQGNVWGQVDRLILAGLWRPDRWQPGYVIKDEYRLPIDPATPPGTYHFEVGLYDFETGVTYGVAKNIGQLTLTPAQKLPTREQLQTEQLTLAPLNKVLTLVEHSYQQAVIAPGAEISGKIFWQLNDTIQQDYQVQFWLNEQGSERKYIVHEGLLSENYPTSQWRQSELVGTAYRFRASAYAPAGEYPLMVSLLDPETGQTVGQDVSLAQVTVQAVERNYDLPQDVSPISAYLNDEIELVGFELENDAISAKENFGLTLYWRGHRPAEANYTVFIHVVGPDQSMRGQWDSLPVQGTSSTSGWLPGEVIVDHYDIPMSKNVPAWKYDIFVGMYDANTGQRLPMYSAESSISDNRVWLSQILVVDDEQ